MAVSTLADVFPNIRWGETVITPAEGLPSGITAPDYYNRAATFSTTMDIAALKSLFKEIEKACGRTVSSKSTGLVPLDIDLLRYGSQILKPNDMKSTYVRQAIVSLFSC
ncbi:2-amino-4-hydroxy-6-hydroxymethyldihydropteridine diphosphokinase [uncultured Bacteroides sp.]|uniref:2-amino-4-hydroxy-6- hydroxymethyldihydropteridine diphosphokinase n=1 Tax=uncultured Bacteroides sp. TaxID=162156 RepID=UPI0026232305|nr:2-amino-4-hydroxy-6-hydroxymethyldihydropteridine diphosphokinase [uncultured Bacteroides sp.]